MTIEFPKIMVGIDSSEESINAADYAIAIASKYKCVCTSSIIRAWGD